MTIMSPSNLGIYGHSDSRYNKNYMQAAILGQSQDVQCNLGIYGYSDSRYVCGWPSSDSPRMYNITWESMDTLIVGI